MKNLTIFSKHFWPENFKINDIAFKLKKKITVNVFTSVPNYNNSKYKHKKKNGLARDASPGLAALPTPTPPGSR